MKILEKDTLNQNYDLIPWWKTDLGKGAGVKVEESLANRWITQGPVTERLQAKLGKLLDVPYVVLTTSGSAALLMALVACGVRQDDEVIIPAMTFISTAQAPTLLGAVIKLVDVESQKPVIDVKNLTNEISQAAKAIIPVHINGRSADMNAINKIAVKHGLKVIEDASQAFYSKNQNGFLGLQSDVGVFSLGMTKFITCGSGGFVVTRNQEIYEKLITMRNFGNTSSNFNNPRYDINGFNFKFNDILASIGLSQLENIDSKVTSHKEIYEFYKNELADLDCLKILEVDVHSGELPLWVEAMSPVRDQLIQLLRKQNIQAKPFDPCVGDSLKANRTNDYPYALKFAQNGLILPCGSDQTPENLKRTVSVLREIQKQLLVGVS